MKKITGTVNWGIIGCGDVCEVKSGPAFQKVPHSKLVAVMRRDKAKARDYAQRHRVPVFYNDAAELVNDDKVNAVYIATPPSSHEAYTAMALKAGKPVYVEKPVTLDAASCERMIALETEYQIPVSVAHYRRALPLFNKVKQILTNGTIGNVHHIQLNMLQPPVNDIIAKTEVNWRINPDISGGGLFHDLAPHQLDFIYWIFGEPEVVRVKASNPGGFYNAPNMTILMANFPNDMQLQGVWNFNETISPATDECIITGDKGSLRFPFFQAPVLTLITANGIQKFRHNNPVHIQQLHIEKVVAFFRGEGSNPCSLEEALVTMKIMDKAVL